MMKPCARLAAFAILAALPLFFASCIGVNVDITIDREGAGVAALEYRLSREADSPAPILPVSRVDFERGMARLEGVRLDSFSAASENDDNVYRAKLAFDSVPALISFMDAYGVKLTPGTGGANSLLFSLTDGGKTGSPEARQLAAALLDGYEWSFNFSLPNDGRLLLLDETGNPLDTQPVDTRLVSAGKKLSFSIPAPALFSGDEGLAFRVDW